MLTWDQCRCGSENVIIRAYPHDDQEYGTCQDCGFRWSQPGGKATNAVMMEDKPAD